jgi:rhamnosyltransferase
VGGQVEGVILIDNGSEVLIEENVCDMAAQFNCTYISQPDNPGLAAAQNEGIDYALSRGFRYCLFLDQDSCLTDGMVSLLLEGFTSLEGLKIAAVGPSIDDARASRSPLDAETTSQDNDLYAVRLMISSGMLVPISVLVDVGIMDCSLFIDHVDHEWCLRATSMGYMLLKSPSASLHHNLGDYSRRVWFLRWRSIAIHSPVRDFYRVRNSIVISRRTQLPTAARLYLLFHSLAVVFFTLLVAPQKAVRMKYIGAAIISGLKNIAGKFGS